jgi:hypothetical protein
MYENILIQILILLIIIRLMDNCIYLLFNYIQLIHLKKMYVAFCEMYNFVNWKKSNSIEGDQMEIYI